MALAQIDGSVAVAGPPCLFATQPVGVNTTQGDMDAAI